jgi:hypothetical protein
LRSFLKFIKNVLKQLFWKLVKYGSTGSGNDVHFFGGHFSDHVINKSRLGILFLSRSFTFKGNQRKTRSNGNVFCVHRLLRLGKAPGATGELDMEVCERLLPHLSPGIGVHGLSGGQLNPLNGQVV